MPSTLPSTISNRPGAQIQNEFKSKEPHTCGPRTYYGQRPENSVCASVARAGRPGKNSLPGRNRSLPGKRRRKSPHSSRLQKERIAKLGETCRAQIAPYRLWGRASALAELPLGAFHDKSALCQYAVHWFGK